MIRQFAGRLQAQVDSPAGRTLTTGTCWEVDSVSSTAGPLQEAKQRDADAHQRFGAIHCPRTCVSRRHRDAMRSYQLVDDQDPTWV